MHGINVFIVSLLPSWPDFSCDPFRHVSSLSTRVINAGKSALNEDQARCEVLVIKRKPGGNPASSQISMTRRRSSLPNGEGLDLLGSLVSEMACIHLMKAFLLYGPEVPTIAENDPVSDVHFGCNGLVTATDAASTNPDPDLIVFHLASAGSHVPKKTWNLMLLFAALSCLRVSGSGTSVKYREVILQM